MLRCFNVTPLPSSSLRSLREATAESAKLGKQHPSLAIEVAIYRMGNLPDTKLQEKWERQWKMAPGPKWLTNGRRNGKMDLPKWPKSHFGVHFSISVTIFWRFGPGAIFHFLFPFSPDFRVGQVSHSVYGHFDRNPSQSTSFSKDLSVAAYLYGSTILWKRQDSIPKANRMRDLLESYRPDVCPTSSFV